MIVQENQEWHQSDLVSEDVGAAGDEADGACRFRHERFDEELSEGIGGVAAQGKVESEERQDDDAERWRRAASKIVRKCLYSVISPHRAQCVGLGPFHRRLILLCQKGSTHSPFGTGPLRAAP